MSSQPLPPPDDHEDVRVTTEQLEQLLALKKELDELMENHPSVTQALATRRRYEKLWREVFRTNAGRHAHAFQPSPTHSHESERPPWLHTTNVKYSNDLSPLLRNPPGMSKKHGEER